MAHEGQVSRVERISDLHADALQRFLDVCWSNSYVCRPNNIGPRIHILSYLKLGTEDSAYEKLTTLLESLS